MKVCTELFPVGYSKYQKTDGYELDDQLKIQLDILLKNIKNDWDFTIIITGQGETRVGKSVLAMQIGAYWTYMIKKMYNIDCPFSVTDNFIYDGKKLIETGNRLGQNFKYSALIYDEAGADLEGRKAMQTMTQDVLDFYRECGQYNLLNILVLPEFFDLPKGIALSRSIFLIDVYYTADEEGIFQRGFFNFYSRRKKKYLYLVGKKNLDYKAGSYDFHGKFTNFYPINEQDYRNAKQEALTKRENKRRNKFQTQRDACWYLLTNEFGMSYEQLGIRMENLTGIFVPKATLSDGIRHFKLEND